MHKQGFHLIKNFQLFSVEFIDVVVIEIYAIYVELKMTTKFRGKKNSKTHCNEHPTISMIL
jgi:hypothetical protein